MVPLTIFVWYHSVGKRQPEIPALPNQPTYLYLVLFFFFFFPHTSTFQLLDELWSQVSSLLPPGSCLQFFRAYRRVQQSHCSSIFHRVYITLSRFPQVNLCTRKSPNEYIRVYTAGLELTNLTYTRLEDNLIRHRGDRIPVLQQYKY